DNGHREDNKHEDQVHDRVVEHRVREEGVALLLLGRKLGLVADAAVDHLADGDGHQSPTASSSATGRPGHGVTPSFTTSHRWMKISPPINAGIISMCRA